MKFSRIASIILFCTMTYVITSFAASFDVFWDPNCNTDSDLSGYNLCYKTTSIKSTGLAGATVVHIDLNQAGFDKLNPGCSLNLPDNTVFYFVVTAMYGAEEESDMSNEIHGINGKANNYPTPTLQNPRRLRVSG
jgi:hypothetical protein